MTLPRWSKERHSRKLEEIFDHQREVCAKPILFALIFHFIILRLGLMYFLNDPYWENQVTARGAESAKLPRSIKKYSRSCRTFQMYT